MLSLLSIFFTCLALILIPCLFIFRRPSVPLFLKKTIIFIKTATSQYNDEEESSVLYIKEWFLLANLKISKLRTYNIVSVNSIEAK
ncbi:unnamed protein product [Brassica oleracea]